MEGMFYVRTLAPTTSSRKPFPATQLSPSPPRTALSPPVQQLTLASYAPLATRQDAYAFNQPLSFDTSSVTRMWYLFDVRTLAPTTTREPASQLCRSRSPPAHRPLYTSPVFRPACTSPRFRYMPSPSGALGPCPAPNLQPDPPLHADCFAAAPSFRSTRRLASYRPPCDSAGYKLLVQRNQDADPLRMGGQPS